MRQDMCGNTQYSREGMILSMGIWSIGKGEFLLLLEKLEEGLVDASFQSFVIEIGMKKR